jgi:hypothetical protein
MLLLGAARPLGLGAPGALAVYLEIDALVEEAQDVGNGQRVMVGVRLGPHQVLDKPLPHARAPLSRGAQRRP